MGVHARFRHSVHRAGYASMDGTLNGITCARFSSQMASICVQCIEQKHEPGGVAYERGRV